MNNTFGSRFIDPAGATMAYNAYEAEKARRFNADQAQINRDFQAEQAQINRDFQERMSNTAWQRAIEDGKKAGINPYIAYHAASVPSGGQAAGFGASGPSAAYTGASNAVAYANMINSVSNLIDTGRKLFRGEDRAYSNLSILNNLSKFLSKL